MTSAIYWILGLLIVWMLFSNSIEGMASSPGVFDQLASTSPYYVPSAWGEGYEWPAYPEYDPYYRNPGYGSVNNYPRATGWTWY